MDKLEDFENARLRSRILSMHYIEESSQAQIAKELNLSTVKVNRMIRQAKEQGWLNISINTPFKSLFELEQQLTEKTALPNSVVTPSWSQDPAVRLRTVGEAGANYLLEQLKDGDTICISGGKAVSAIADALNPKHSYPNVKVVPASGGVQGKYFTDVNHLVSRIAERLGAQAMTLHAPLFVESRAVRDMLMELKQCKEILDMARAADFALLGVGSILPDDSSFFDLNPLSPAQREEIIEAGAIGDLFAHLYDKNGELCQLKHNDTLVALSFEELAAIPCSIGMAVGDDKVDPIAGVLHSKRLKTLITDELTAKAVIEKLS